MYWFHFPTCQWPTTYIISYEPGTLKKVQGTLFALMFGKRSSLSLTQGSFQMRRFSYSVVSIVMSLGQNVKTGGSVSEI